MVTGNRKWAVFALVLAFASARAKSAHADEGANHDSTVDAGTPPTPSEGLAPALAPPEKHPGGNEVPVLHHAPILTATMSEDVKIEATFGQVHLMKRAILVFRGGGTHGEIELGRSSTTDGYAAMIPATAVRGELAYAIEIETTRGDTLAVFATRTNPYPVTVLDGAQDRREQALLERLGGRRSVVGALTEYVSFGTGTTNLAAPGKPPQLVESPDRYFRVEGAYTYRLLGIVSEFGIRAGAVRGESIVPGERDPSKYAVGLNYGAPRLRLRALDWLHFEGELLTSVTEVGFSVGGGGSVLIGDPYGSKVVFGAEGIEVFGARGFTRLDVMAHPRVLLSPIVEVTGMPHADAVGVRLLGEGRFELGKGLGLTVRGGYQARTFDRGGPTLGGGLAYAF